MFRVIFFLVIDDVYDDMYDDMYVYFQNTHIYIYTIYTIIIYNLYKYMIFEEPEDCQIPLIKAGYRTFPLVSITVVSSGSGFNCLKHVEKSRKKKKHTHIFCPAKPTTVEPRELR